MNSKEKKFFDSNYKIFEIKEKPACKKSNGYELRNFKNNRDTNTNFINKEDAKYNKGNNEHCHNKNDSEKTELEKVLELVDMTEREQGYPLNLIDEKSDYSHNYHYANDFLNQNFEYNLINTCGYTDKEKHFLIKYLDNYNQEKYKQFMHLIKNKGNYKIVNPMFNYGTIDMDKEMKKIRNNNNVGNKRNFSYFNETPAQQIPFRKSNYYRNMDIVTPYREIRMNEQKTKDTSNIKSIGSVTTIKLKTDQNSNPKNLGNITFSDSQDNSFYESQYGNEKVSQTTNDNKNDPKNNDQIVSNFYVHSESNITQQMNDSVNAKKNIPEVKNTQNVSQVANILSIIQLSQNDQIIIKKNQENKNDENIKNPEETIKIKNDLIQTTTNNFQIGNETKNNKSYSIKMVNTGINEATTTIENPEKIKNEIKVKNNLEENKLDYEKNVEIQILPPDSIKSTESLNTNDKFNLTTQDNINKDTFNYTNIQTDNNLPKTNAETDQTFVSDNNKIMGDHFKFNEHIVIKGNQSEHKILVLNNHNTIKTNLEVLNKNPDLNAAHDVNHSNFLTDKFPVGTNLTNKVNPFLSIANQSTSNNLLVNQAQNYTNFKLNNINKFESKNNQAVNLATSIHNPFIVKNTIQECKTFIPGQEYISSSNNNEIYEIKNNNECDMEICESNTNYHNNMNTTLPRNNTNQFLGLNNSSSYNLNNHFNNSQSNYLNNNINNALPMFNNTNNYMILNNSIDKSLNKNNIQQINNMSSAATVGSLMTNPFLKVQKMNNAQNNSNVSNVFLQPTNSAQTNSDYNGSMFQERPPEERRYLKVRR